MSRNAKAVAALEEAAQAADILNERRIPRDRLLAAMGGTDPISAQDLAAYALAQDVVIALMLAAFGEIAGATTAPRTTRSRPHRA